MNFFKNILNDHKCDKNALTILLTRIGEMSVISYIINWYIGILTNL